MSLADPYEAFARLRQTAATWASLPAAELESAWQGAAGESYREVMAMRLWEQGGLMRDRDLVEASIRALQAASDMRSLALLGHLLVLLLYKRIPEGFAARLDESAGAWPDWFVTYCRTALAGHGRHLEILPPVRDFTVTVGLLAYNRPELLERAIQSVLNQSYADFRLLIGDDCSSDPAVERMCRDYAARDARVRYLRQPRNIGQPRNFDALMDAAETELVMGLADDDYYDSGFLASCVALMRAKPWLSVVITPCRFQSPEGQSGQFGPFYSRDGVGDPDLELQRAGASGGVYLVGFLYRRRILREVARYDLFPQPDGYVPRYGMQDCSIAGACLLHYEVGYIREAGLNFWLSELNASRRRDTALEHIRFFRFVLAAHADLFGLGAYPPDLARYCLDAHILERVMRLGFDQLLEGEAGQFDAQLEALLPSWAEFNALAHALPAACQLGRQPRISPDASVYGDNPWGKFHVEPAV